MLSKTYICCVAKCTNTSIKRPDKEFFCIPTDFRRDLWLQLISREDLREVKILPRTYRVCEEHFTRDAIVFTNTRILLKKTALPSRSLPSLESHKSSKIFTSKLTQTDNLETIANTDWDEKIAAAEISCASELDKMHKMKQARRQFYDQCDTYLTRDLSSLVKANDCMRHKTDKLDNDEYWQFYGNLYQTSPQAYNFFQKIYNMPAFAILLKHYVKIGTTVNDTLLLTTKARINKMSDKERNCSVLIGTVRLKANLCYNIREDKIYGFQEIDGVQSTEPATVALVLMIRGLFSDWKQPLGYISINQNDDVSSIKNWIHNIIKQLFEIGLNVRTLVSSTKDHWITEIVNERPVSSESPFCLVNGKKIYYIFDAPDLMKAARDSMRLYDIHYQSKVARYIDIVKFYKADQKREVPYAQNITSSHIEPDDQEKQDATYAIELLNKTVANGLWNYMQFGFVENADMGAVEFIANMSTFYDALNASNQKGHGTERKQAVSEKDINGELKEMLSYFENLKVIDSKKAQDVTLSVKFSQCISITIKAVMLLLNELKTEEYSFLPTKNLHRKSLDDFIQKLPSCAKKTSKKLTAWTFTTAFRKLFLSNLKKFTLGGGSKGEIKNFLAQISHLEEDIAETELTAEPVQIKISNPRSERSVDTSTLTYKDYSIIDTSEKHSIMYICGCLLIQLRNIHNTCYIFKYYLYSHKYEPDPEIGRFCRYNQHIMVKKNIKLPAAPCDSFVEFVEKMDAKFVKAFTNKHLDQRIADSLYKDIEDIPCTLPCPCFPKQYAIKLFIRMKIFYTIRMNNTLFKTNKSRKRNFVVSTL